MGLKTGTFFSGIGTMDYGFHKAGCDILWTCEKDPWRRAILEKRWPEAKHYDDITTFDCSVVEPVDLVIGAFPPQGFTSMNRGEHGGKGKDHPGFALWEDMVRCLDDLKPRWFFLESIANILRHGEAFGTILRDLSSCGYDVQWDCLPAAAFGAPHRRDRLFLTAHLHSDCNRQQGFIEMGKAAISFQVLDPAEMREQVSTARGVTLDWGENDPAIKNWGRTLGRACPEPLVRRMDDGSSRGLVRSRAGAVGDGVLLPISEFCAHRIVEADKWG